jgi:hypothetical protein
MQILNKLIVAAGLVVLTAAGVQAREKIVVTKIAKPQQRALAEFLRPGGGNSEPPAVNFKVPAVNVGSIVVCEMSAQGLRCGEYPNVRCPTEVVVELPDNSNTTVPVRCTGPDANGECDCDFVGH